MKNNFALSFLLLSLAALSLASCKRAAAPVTGPNIIPPPPPMRETLPEPHPKIEIIPAKPPAMPENHTDIAPSRIKPRIAIIIDDMGVDRVRSRAVLGLPAPLTLSYLPYAPDVAAQAARARAAGDELLVHVPMEPLDVKNEIGASFLTTSMSPDVLSRALAQDLAAFPGYVGINNHMGSRLTQDRVAMDVIMTQLHARDLLFVDSRTIAGSVAAESAAAHGVPETSRDVFLDDDPDEKAVWRQLATVERVARVHGVAVAIGHPKDGTIAALRRWLPTLAQKGFIAVRISAVVEKQDAATVSSVPLPAPVPPRG